MTACRRKVLDALDDYLAESASKLLVVHAAQGRAREEMKSKRPPRAALMMECFDPPAEPQQHLARLDVVAKHATSALYNAVEHRRIPLRWLWMPLARLQEGLGGRTSAIVMACCVALTLIIAILCLVPYPLKVESNGKLLPQTRCYVYAPMPVASSISWWRPANRSPRAAAWWKCTISRILESRSSRCVRDITNLQRQIDVQKHRKDNKDLDASKRADMEKDVQSRRPSWRAKPNRWRRC